MTKKLVTEVIAGGLTEFDTEMYADVEGGGFEGVGINDVAIPYLRVLQALSGEIKDKAKRVEGAVIGDIYLSAVGRLYKGDVGVSVVPCAFHKKYVERLVGVNGGAGFVASHSDRAILERTERSPDNKYDMLDNGHHIVETAYHYVIVDDGGDNLRAVISFASTQRKKSRAWLALMGAIKWEVHPGVKITPPSFAHSYRLTSGEESKDQNDWYGWVIGQPERITDRQLALDAKRLYKDVVGGTVTAGVDSDESVKVNSEEIPF